ncbi:hybrid sensor histidine kinase/response regulator [Pseudoduganella buxea]|uniref:histidine kinase n=1 Tax=Pseudoduganella buxea TaxID=1949069 RepID=A0A6I3T990_9BURK|nr:ATP-binding protein [Pseudoduganella buxea]MTV56217.1 response regulator [Pseudoduganella buxea]GGC00787.1 hypothetical protein GCM10011572_23500 [Pseudoduganella buxea]
MVDVTPLEQRVLVCTPYGKDASLTAQLLSQAGMACTVCDGMAAVWDALAQGAGALLTVEEVLAPDVVTALQAWLGRQSAWSDLPILVLTRMGERSAWAVDAYERLGNLTLIERPVRPQSLVSATRSALRARQRQYEIRQADQRKDEFLAMLAHELRNPLSPISAAAALLGIAADDPAKVRAASAIITRQVGQMTHLINDLLDVARVTRGLIVLEHVPLDLRDIVTEALEQAAPLVASRHHRLDVRLPSTPAPVTGDVHRLIQVVSNLLSNAAKYTPEGGAIDVALAVQGEQVVLQVADNGIGIAPGMIDHVFELFSQAERTPDRSQGGLGLGLALVQSLAESHGGGIAVSSPGAGRGSVFTLTLPRREAAAPCHAHEDCAPRKPAAANIAPLRVLVVDDNVDAADALSLVLGTAGHAVTVAHSPAQALAAHARYDACLLDIGLPGIDGYELARQLRRRPELAGSCFIAVTGYGMANDRQCALAAGFDGYLVKPVDVAELDALLARLPRPRRAGRAGEVKAVAPPARPQAAPS